MTLGDLKKALINRLSSRVSQLRDNTNTVNTVVYESDYDKLKKLTPEQRYQRMKGDNFNTRYHNSIRYWNYLEIFNRIAPDPFTHYKTGEQRMAAYWKASNAAEAELTREFPDPQDQGCTNSKCTVHCRFFEPEGTIDDSELKEYYN
jgi:hypothetical protein